MSSRKKRPDPVDSDAASDSDSSSSSDSSSEQVKTVTKPSASSNKKRSRGSSSESDSAESPATSPKKQERNESSDTSESESGNDEPTTPKSSETFVVKKAASAASSSSAAALRSPVQKPVAKERDAKNDTKSPTKSSDKKNKAESKSSAPAAQAPEHEDESDRSEVPASPKKTPKKDKKKIEKANVEVSDTDLEEEEAAAAPSPSKKGKISSNPEKKENNDKKKKNAKAASDSASESEPQPEIEEKKKDTKKKKAEKKGKNEKKRKRSSDASSESESDAEPEPKKKKEKTAQRNKQRPAKKAKLAEKTEADADKSSEQEAAQPEFDIDEDEAFDKHSRAIAYRVTKDEEGNEFRIGPFTNEEHEAVIDAIQKYMEDHNLSFENDLQELLRGEIKNHKRPWKHIAADVPNRTYVSVRNHARRTLHDLKRGPWDVEEEQRLHELNKLHPNQWVTIGRELNRLPGDVRDKVRSIGGGTFNTGRWSEEETERFLKILKKMNGGELPADDDPQISWTELSKKMRTRNMNQCIVKWREYRPNKFSSPLFEGTRKYWSMDDDKILVLKLSLLRPTDRREIIIAQLSKQWPRSDVQVRWQSLQRQIPYGNTMPFPELLSKLRILLRLDKEERARLQRKYNLDEW